jgi:hypothetical protein
MPAPVAELVAGLAAKDPQRRPGDALAVAEWAWRVRDDPQVIQAPPGPVRMSGSLIPAEPARGKTGNLRRRLSRSSAVAALLLPAAGAGRTAQYRISSPSAA